MSTVECVDIVRAPVILPRMASAVEHGFARRREARARVETRLMRKGAKESIPNALELANLIVLDARRRVGNASAAVLKQPRTVDPELKWMTKQPYSNCSPMVLLHSTGPHVLKNIKPIYYIGQFSLD